EAPLGPYPNPAEPRGDEMSAPSNPEEAPGDAGAAQAFFAEDWWTHTRPAVVLHGNFRVRSELYDHFSLGRVDPPGVAAWPRPLDDYYVDVNGGDWGAEACTPREVADPNNNSNSPGDATQGCSNST